jgi:hypothetical protein
VHAFVTAARNTSIIGLNASKACNQDDHSNNKVIEAWMRECDSAEVPWKASGGSRGRHTWACAAFPSTAALPHRLAAGDDGGPAAGANALARSITNLRSATATVPAVDGTVDPLGFGTTR